MRYQDTDLSARFISNSDKLNIHNNTIINMVRMRLKNNTNSKFLKMTHTCKNT